MSGSRIPIHGRNHRVGGSDPINFPVSGSEFAVGGINGPYDVPSDTPTYIGIDLGGIVTNAANVFTTDSSTAASGYGVGIHSPGTYLALWTVNFRDQVGHRVISPENYAVEAEDASGSITVIVPFMGSVYARGYTDLAGVGSWDVAWFPVFAVDVETAVDDPIVVQANQSTGETLKAYTNVYVEKKSTDTFGF